jgi:hypothetical protein
MKWLLLLGLGAACHRTEYVDVPRAGGGTVRVVKAREPFSKKLDVDFDRYFVIRQDAAFAAIRLGRRPGGGAVWDCSYQGDGSGELTRGTRAHGELFETLTAAGPPAGVFSMAGSQLNVACGPLVIGWSPGNWVYPRGLWTGADQARHEQDRGVDVATTSARDLAEVDVFDVDLDWLAPW